MGRLLEVWVKQKHFLQKLSVVQILAMDTILIQGLQAATAMVDQSATAAFYKEGLDAQKETVQLICLEKVCLTTVIPSSDL